MFRRRLPGQTKGMVLRVIVGIAPAARIRREERRALRLVVETARREFLAAPPSMRRVEPQSVPLQRAPKASAHIVDALDRGSACEPTCTQRVGQVARLKL